MIFANPNWHYGCLEELKARERRDKTSMGMVKVREVVSVKLEERSDEERMRHAEKLARLRSKLDLFDEPQRHLQFFPFRVRVGWLCEDVNCPGHTAAVLDWGLGELGRREGADKALARMQELTRIEKYDLRFYMGNFKAHPRNFGIVGLWYPLIRDVNANPIQEDLFG